MIAPHPGFGRSKASKVVSNVPFDTTGKAYRVVSNGTVDTTTKGTFDTTILVAFCLAMLAMPLSLYAIGSSGLYATQVKFEYQYSDYNQYKFPVLSSDSFHFEYIDPYIVNFPEHRSLAKVTQSLGPITSLEARYEYSGLTDAKNQHRYHFRLDRAVTPMTTLYMAYQDLEVTYDSPDSAKSGGYMVMAGVKHDRSGWLKGEFSLSYDHNKASDGFLVETFMPMAQIRWSVNSATALNLRWDGYWSDSDSGLVPAHALTFFISRYFPTRTALHLFTRLYHNNVGIRSIAPAIEVAQYLRWNLTARLTYRYYFNHFDDEALPNFIKGRSIRSHTIRTNLEWQIGAALKLHFKYRRYFSNQDIKMNTYLLGFEYEL